MGVWKLPQRWVIFAISLSLAYLFIFILTLSLSKPMAVIILGHGDGGAFSLGNLCTLQNLMYIFFFIGLGEMFTRWRVSVRENAFMGRKLLPEDDSVLQAHDLASYRHKVVKEYDAEHGFLPYLIDICILQFHASRSVDQVISVLNSSLDLISHRVDLRYSLARYIVWLIPTIGFIGTVLGIASSLTKITPPDIDFSIVTSSLGMAFNTTLIALILSALLVFLLHVVQKLEEQSVNLAGNYCLRNLVNRLYAGK